MGLHPENLTAEYHAVIEHRRIVSDKIWRFIHMDDESRGPWVGGAIQMLREDQPDLCAMDGMNEVLDRIAAEPHTNVAEFFFWVCAWLYPALQGFLTSEEGHFAPERVAKFLKDDLNRLCNDFITGNQTGSLTIDAFLRAVRPTYMTVVGVPVD